jgi:ankyrin repeat protein
MSGALHRATAHGVCIVKLLVDAKADLNVQEDDPDHDEEWISTTFGARIEHWTPLHHVCSEGDAASAKVLLDAGAITDLQDAQMKTPLHLAIDADHGDCIDLLLSFGANVELGNNSAGADNSPLMEAAMAGKEELVKKLIGAKADVNKQGKQDMSALHLAARKRHARVAESLIAAKADMTQESKCGTALYLARKNGGADLLKVFGVEPLGDLAGVDNVITSVAKLDAAQQAALHLD